MSEGPELRTPRRRFFHKRTADIIIAVAALFVSAVSLWVAVRTQIANEQLVQGSTWPFAQIQVSDVDAEGKLDLHFGVINAGVGPAKIESFELFWKGKAFRAGDEFLARCCGYRSVKIASPESKTHTALLRGTIQGIVLRAGEKENFISYKLNADNLAIWTALNKARDEITYRICYCSVLNQCWRRTLRSELFLPGQLEPEEVSRCPVPAVAYTD